MNAWQSGPSKFSHEVDKLSRGRIVKVNVAQFGWWVWLSFVACSSIACVRFHRYGSTERSRRVACAAGGWEHVSTRLAELRGCPVGHRAAEPLLLILLAERDERQVDREIDQRGSNSGHISHSSAAVQQSEERSAEQLSRVLLRVSATDFGDSRCHCHSTPTARSPQPQLAATSSPYRLPSRTYPDLSVPAQCRRMNVHYETRG